MPAASVITTLTQRLQGELRPLVSACAPVAIRTAPGKVDVLGALAVDAGGTIAQMTLPRRVAVAFAKRTDGRLEVHCPDIAAPLESSVSLGAEKFLVPEGAGDAAWRAPGSQITALYTQASAWAWPVIAAWWSLIFTGKIALPLEGATVIFHSGIPTGAEQGSSVALIAATVEAVAAGLALEFSANEKATFIQRAEGLLGPGHLIDALAVMHAPEGPTAKLLWLSAQPHELAGMVRMPSELRLLALDINVHARGAAGTVRELRLAGAMGLRIIETIYRDLGQRHTPLRGYLVNLSPSLYRQYFRNLLPRKMRGIDFVRAYGSVPERAGAIEPERLYRVRTAVDHLISENEYAGSFLQAIEELSDAGHVIAGKERELVRRRAGRLLTASHHSYRLRLGLSVPQADWLVNTLTDAGPERGIYGARISGCGGGGTVVALLNRTSQADDALLDVMNEFHRRTLSKLNVVEAGGSGSGGVLSQ